MMRQVLVALCLLTCVSARSLTVHALHSANGFTWRADRSAGFDFYFEPNSTAERDIEKIKKIMDGARAHINTLLGGNPSLRISVFLVESRPRMKELVGHETNGVAGAAVQAAIYSDKVKAIGGHESCHILARALWGDAHGVWVNEGLAVYSDDQWWGLPLHSLARGMMDRHQLVALRDLARNMRKYDDVVTYPELGSFVKFVYETRGRDAVKALWQNGAPKDLDQLEKAWLAEVAKAEPKSVDYGTKR
jgi:hypothetical protein